MSQILEVVKRERLPSLTVNSTNAITAPHGVLPFGCSLYDQHRASAASSCPHSNPGDGGNHEPFIIFQETMT